MLSQKELMKELLLFDFEKVATKRTSGSHIRFVYKYCNLLEIGFNDHKDVTNLADGLYIEVVGCLVMLAYHNVVENGEIQKTKVKDYFKSHDKGLKQEIVTKLKKLLTEKEISWAKMIPSSIYRKVEHLFGNVNNETIQEYFKKGRNVED